MTLANKPAMLMLKPVYLHERCCMRDGDKKFQSATVMFFQVFSAAVLCKHTLFDGVNKYLKAIDAEYRQIYPALLKINK